MDAVLQAAGHLASISVILAAFGGVLWGILGGALPGISPSIAMALLLPFTVAVTPTKKAPRAAKKAAWFARLGMTHVCGGAPFTERVSVRPVRSPG